MCTDKRRGSTNGREWARIGGDLACAAAGICVGAGEAAEAWGGGERLVGALGVCALGRDRVGGDRVGGAGVPRRVTVGWVRMFPKRRVRVTGPSRIDRHRSSARGDRGRRRGAWGRDWW